MPLDRQSIEKRDFPIAPGGYDRDAVDAHLSQIAAEVEQLRAAPRETLAASASEQVRTILEAAENSAAEIQRQATAQAKVIWQRLRAIESELSAILEGQPGEGQPAAGQHAGDLAGGSRATGENDAAAPAAEPPPDAGDDTDGARLIALNMAQNGASREETDRYLSENFSLNDRASLLDEVYSSIS